MQLCDLNVLIEKALISQSAKYCILNQFFLLVMCISMPWFTEHIPRHITLEYHKCVYSAQVALRSVVLYRCKPGRTTRWKTNLKLSQ